MQKYLLFILFVINNIFSQCNPLDVSIYISEQDGWMFPYSAFYWGMNDGVTELSITNPECMELLEDNADCIANCLYLEQNEVDEYLGRIGCIFYTCPDGELLVHNYDELSERPIHIYGQYYCSEGTVWNEELNVCQPNICNGDLNGDETKDILDILIMVNDILTDQNSCEE